MSTTGKSIFLNTLSFNENKLLRQLNNTNVEVSCNLLTTTISESKFVKLKSDLSKLKVEILLLILLIVLPSYNSNILLPFKTNLPLLENVI